MSVRTAYSLKQGVAYAGMPYDLNDKDTESAINTEASASIPFGVFVLQDSANDDGAKLMSGSTDVPLGCVIKSDNYAAAWTDSQGTVHGELGSGGLAPGAQMGIAYRGRIYVVSETDAVKGDPLWIRYSASGPNTQPGSVGNATGTGRTIHISGKYLATCTAGSVVAIDFDCVSAHI